MPLQLSVGLSQKIGQPCFGSLGASCGITLELESRLLELDSAAFQARVQAAYQACQEAIEAELGRHQASQPVGINKETHRRKANGRIARAERLATPAQRRLLARLADRRGVVLEELLRRHSGADRVQPLSVAQASQLITELRGTEADSPTG